MKKIHKPVTQGLAATILVICCGIVEAQTPVVSPAASENPQAEQATTSQKNQLQKSIEQSSVVAPVASNSVATTPAAVSKPGTASQLANLMGGLALILILIFGLSWFVKRFSQGGFMQNPAMKIVAAMPLGTRERLMLVAIGDKQILLGVTATQISNLHVFEHPVVATSDKEPGSDFSQKLMAILQQKNISQSGDSSSRDRRA